MTFTSRLAAVALASLLVTGTASAQTTTPAAKTDTVADKKATKERSAESLECSKQADAKGLKGKERKQFRRECKKEAKAGSAAAAPAAPAADKK